MKLGGALARRANQPVDGYCPIERALGLLQPKSTILVLREAFYGATRFDEFAARTELTDATTSARLRALVQGRHPRDEAVPGAGPTSPRRVRAHPLWRRPDAGRVRVAAVG